MVRRPDCDSFEKAIHAYIDETCAELQKEAVNDYAYRLLRLLKLHLDAVMSHMKLSLYTRDDKKLPEIKAHIKAHEDIIRRIDNIVRPRGEREK